MNGSSTRPVVALLTDFGEGDGDVGVMKGVIAGITPDTLMIDITHDVHRRTWLQQPGFLPAPIAIFPPGRFLSVWSIPALAAVAAR